MSPMVAMRTASEMASVETPSSAAMSVIGTTRSSGRSSSAVETTLTSIGMRLAWLVSSAATCVTAAASRPEATSWNWRWPLSCMNQKRMSGTPARLRLISSLTWACDSLRFSFGHQVDDERRLAHLAAGAQHASADDEYAPHLRPLADLLRQRIGDGARLLHARAGRQLDGQHRAAAVLRRQEARRQQIEAAHRAGEHKQAQSHRLVLMADRPVHHMRIGAQHARLFFLVTRRAHEIGRQQRRDEPRHQQREQHGEGHHQAELLEVLAGDAAHEADRHEHGDDGEGDGDHGQADLVGRLQRGAIGALAHAHVAHDVLDLDDGVVDEDAGDDGDGQQADQVEREAGHVERPEGRDDGQRQRDRRNQCGAPVAQEDEDHDDGQDGALDHGLHGRIRRRRACR